MQLITQLKERVYNVVLNVKQNALGVAFSGGVDSSLLAKACKDVKKNVTLLTTAFASLNDITISRTVSKELNLASFHEVFSLEDLEQGLQTVLSIISLNRLAHLENCVCFYFVFKIASG